MQLIAYDSFDPEACAFPSPRVPMLPTSGYRAIARSSSSDSLALVGAGRPQRHYTRGRYALLDAYRLSGVGPGGSLLMPAYHCRTMLDPAIRLGAQIVLYKLDHRLAPDLRSLEQLAGAASNPVRAILLTHYFGVAQDLEPIKSFCDSRDIVLIEDCSHALLNLSGGARIGSHGRFAVTSPYKFLPCEEGGTLFAADGDPLPVPRAPGLRAEVRTLANAAEHAWSHRRSRLRPSDAQRLDADIRAIVDAPPKRGRRFRSEGAEPSSLYAASQEELASSTTSRWLMAHSDLDHMASCRRANYGRWCESLHGVPHCRPLFDRLPDDCVPYMFPLLVEFPQTHFYLLKSLGVPIWRWDDMAHSDCDVSQHYRDHLLHLPCHQSISEAELSWMTSAVTKIMRLGPSPGREEET